MDNLRILIIVLGHLKNTLFRVTYHGFWESREADYFFHFFNDSPDDNKMNGEARAIYHIRAVITLRFGVVNHRNMAIECGFRRGIIERREKMAVRHVAKQNGPLACRKTGTCKIIFSFFLLNCPKILIRTGYPKQR